MRISKLLIVVSVMTIGALLYVHQQIELVKLSYAIDLKEKRFKDMLDHRDSLSYNIKNLESPLRLEKALFAKNIDVAFPKRTQVVNFNSRIKPAIERGEPLKAAVLERKVNIFWIFDFFSPRAEAQAKEK